jgi:hypothetical protein
VQQGDQHGFIGIIEFRSGSHDEHYPASRLRGTTHLDARFINVHGGKSRRAATTRPGGARVSDNRHQADVSSGRPVGDGGSLARAAFPTPQQSRPIRNRHPGAVLRNLGSEIGLALVTTRLAPHDQADMRRALGLYRAKLTLGRRCTDACHLVDTGEGRAGRGDRNLNGAFYPLLSMPSAARPCVVLTGGHRKAGGADGAVCPRAAPNRKAHKRSRIDLS